MFWHQLEALTGPVFLPLQGSKCWVTCDHCKVKPETAQCVLLTSRGDWVCGTLYSNYSEKYPFARSLSNAPTVAHPRHSSSQPGLTGVQVIPHPPSSCCAATTSLRFACISCSLKRARSGSSGKGAQSSAFRTYPVVPVSATNPEERRCSLRRFISSSARSRCGAYRRNAITHSISCCSSGQMSGIIPQQYAVALSNQAWRTLFLCNKPQIIAVGFNDAGGLSSVFHQGARG